VYVLVGAVVVYVTFVTPLHLVIGLGVTVLIVVEYAVWTTVTGGSTVVDVVVVVYVVSVIVTVASSGPRFTTPAFRATLNVIPLALGYTTSLIFRYLVFELFGLTVP